jgi:hypothetical protein
MPAGIAGERADGAGGSLQDASDQRPKSHSLRKFFVLQIKAIETSIVLKSKKTGI